MGSNKQPLHVYSSLPSPYFFPSCTPCVTLSNVRYKLWVTLVSCFDILFDDSNYWDKAILRRIWVFEGFLFFLWEGVPLHLTWRSNPMKRRMTLQHTCTKYTWGCWMHDMVSKRTPYANKQPSGKPIRFSPKYKYR